MDAATNPAGPDAAPPGPDGSGPPAGKPVRILAVIDEKDLAHLVGAVLGASGNRVERVGTAAEAWRVLSDGGVELVVMDLVLPDTDGRKFLMRLRERADTAAVPVVILSARDDSAIKSECFALGAESFFGKPVDPDALAAAVAGLARDADAVEGRDGGLDPLTGLMSRSGLLDAVTDLPLATPVAVMLLELDRFEDLNQRMGWSSVEVVLGEIGRALPGAAPADAWLARWEGAEFLMLLREVPEGLARAAAESVVAAVRGHAGTEGASAGPLTASAGMTTGVAGDFLEGLLETARYRLFRARAAGGDRLEAEPSTEAVDPIKVVVAEDDPGMGAMLRARLEREGFQLSIHEDGTAAHSAILADRPDLVLLDVRLPGMDGFEILASLRANPDRHDVPVIMITALGRESDLVRGFELGTDDYMVKPFSPTELLARIHRLLGRRGAGR